MLTIFCSPKPFENEADWNQHNALRSWKAIHPDVEIYIFSALPGAAEAAAEVGAVLIPEIDCSPTGAPSFNAMAKYVAEHARHDLQLYVNGDILLNATMGKAMQACHQHFGNFLMVGERLDLARGVTVDVRDEDWLNCLASLARDGQLKVHGPNGVDYFGFTRGMWAGLPQVYMGRSMCDQALLHYSLSHHIPLMDATRCVTAVHQFHDYAHVKGGKQEVFHGADMALMEREHKLKHSLPTILDADWQFTAGGHFISGRRRRLRQWELALRYRYRLEYLALFFRAMQYAGGKKNLQPKKLPINDVLASWAKFIET